MLETEEWDLARMVSSHGTSFANRYIKGEIEEEDIEFNEQEELIGLPDRLDALLQLYNHLTKFNETNPNTVWHHQVDLYGPDCPDCKKPLRTPAAKFCAECGFGKEDLDNNPNAKPLILRKPELFNTAMNDENLNKDEQLLADWLAGKLSEEELEQLQQREDFADLKAIVEGMKGLGMPDFSVEGSWKKLEEKKEEVAKNKEEREKNKEAEAKIVEMPKQEEVKTAIAKVTPPTQPTTGNEQPKETPVRQIGRRKWLYAAAAVLAVLVAMIVLFPEKDPVKNYETAFSTGVGEQTTVKLPDGSTVQLNALSSIHFTETDWPDERNVYLKGEGYFQAKKGRTFTVKTEQGSVRVVGTRFNVFARDTELAVVCTEGTVQVINPADTEKALLKANEQVKVLSGKMQKRHGMDFLPKWFNGESRFRSASRQKVFDELERQFGVTVIAPKIEASPYTGQFSHADLEKAVKAIAIPTGMQYEISNDTVLFKLK